MDCEGRKLWPVFKKCPTLVWITHEIRVQLALRENGMHHSRLWAEIPVQGLADTKYVCWSLPCDVRLGSLSRLVEVTGLLHLRDLS
jgi:hypothetical protein